MTDNELYKTGKINEPVERIMSSQKYKKLADAYRSGAVDGNKAISVINRWIREDKKRFGAMTVRNPKGFIEALDDAVFNRVLTGVQQEKGSESGT